MPNIQLLIPKETKETNKQFMQTLSKLDSTTPDNFKFMLTYCIPDYSSYNTEAQ